MRIPNIVGSRNSYNHHPTVVLNMFHFSSQGTWRRCAYSLNDSQVGSERTAHRCLKQGQAANQKAASLFELDGLAQHLRKCITCHVCTHINYHLRILSYYLYNASKYSFTWLGYFDSVWFFSFFTLPWTLGKKMQEPCHPFGALLPQLTVFSKHGAHHRHTLQLQENDYQGGRIRLHTGTLG